MSIHAQAEHIRFVFIYHVRKVQIHRYWGIDYMAVNQAIVD